MTMSDLPPSTRIKKEITLLEKDVESLEKQFMDLSNEMTQLTSSNNDNKEVAKSNGLRTGNDGQSVVARLELSIPFVDSCRYTIIKG